MTAYVTEWWCLGVPPGTPPCEAGGRGQDGQALDRAATKHTRDTGHSTTCHTRPVPTPETSAAAASGVTGDGRCGVMHSAENDAAYREQAEATIADLRARVSHYEARIAEQIEPEVTEDDLRAFIFEVVRRNNSLPISLLRHYRITPRIFPPAVTEDQP